MHCEGVFLCFVQVVFQEVSLEFLEAAFLYRYLAVLHQAHEEMDVVVAAQPLSCWVVQLGEMVKISAAVLLADGTVAFFVYRLCVFPELACVYHYFSHPCAERPVPGVLGWEDAVKAVNAL